MGWAQMSTLLITFLTRYYGDAVPAYSIRGINPIINCFAPALLAPLFSHLETFACMLPALWLFCLSAAPLALEPSVAAGVAWVVITGFSEAVWAPRSRSWEVTMAPDGQEAIFLTLSGLPAKLIYPTVG